LPHEEGAGSPEPAFREARLCNLQVQPRSTIVRRCFRVLPGAGKCGLARQECGHYSRSRSEGRSTFVFEPGQKPCGEGECIASTKARGASEPTELVELLRDNKPKECPLDHAASVALPYLRWRACFLADKKVGISEFRGVKVRCGSVTQNGVRFRVCEFFAGGWISSFQDALPLRSGPQPSYTGPGL